MDRKNNNLQLLEECFRNARITDELSDSSIEKYRDSVKKFFSVIGAKEFQQLEKRDFDDCILKMRGSGAGNSRIANVISAVKWVVKRLQEEKKIERTLDLEKVRKPKIERREVEYLTEEEITRFLDAINKDIEKGIKVRKVRIMALVVLLLESGARIGEALSIKIGKIDWDNNDIPIIGKGKKPRTLFFRDRSKYWLQKYLSIRNSDNEFLFVTQDGLAKWSQTDVGRSFRRYRDLSGIKKKFVLHTLRHTTATQLSFKGAQFNEIQALLGHTRLETTVKYYIGAVEKQRVKQIMQDKYYDFIPRSALENNETKS